MIYSDNLDLETFFEFVNSGELLEIKYGTAAYFLYNEYKALADRMLKFDNVKIIDKPE